MKHLAVLGSTGTVLVAMDTGFTWIMLGVLPLYVLGIAALYFTLGRPRPEEPARGLEVARPTSGGAVGSPEG